MNEIEQEFVVDVYDKIAHEFDVTRTYKWSWITEFMEHMLPGSLVYDIGCGNGRNMTYPGINFIGIDTCDRFVEICRKNGLNAIKGSMLNILLPNTTADYIICIAAFHHLNTYDHRIKALNEMKRLLKPDGKLLISVWSKTQPKKTRVTFEKYGDTMVPWKNNLTRYYYIFQIDEIVSLFRDAGLRILNHIYDCGNEVFVLSL